MKLLKSEKMRSLLKRGLRAAARGEAPSDGYLSNLIYKTEPNGWHYQVEYIHDTRFHDKPYVTVFAFKPPRKFCARGATHYLDSLS